MGMAACGEPSVDPGPVSDPNVGQTDDVDTEQNSIGGNDTMLLHYGNDVEFEFEVQLPEGAYFDEDDYADYLEDGYMYICNIYDDEKLYSAYFADYWSKDAYTSEPSFYDPFAQYYFYGGLDEETASEFASYSQTVTNLGFQWNGKDVVLIETKSITTDDWEMDDLFVGVEYDVVYSRVNDDGSVDENLTTPGIMGFVLCSNDAFTELDVDKCAWIAGELFGVDSGRTWSVEN